MHPTSSDKPHPEPHPPLPGRLSSAQDAPAGSDRNPLARGAGFIDSLGEKVVSNVLWLAVCVLTA